MTTYSINLATGATSRYEGFSFNSMAKAEDGSYYALTGSGLVKLTGSTDLAAEIKSRVNLGKQDFGTKQHKRLKCAYIGVSSQKPMLLIVGDGTNEFQYTARSSDAVLKEQRFDLGLGLKSNFFTLTLSSQGGLVEASDFSVTVAASTRRI